MKKSFLNITLLVVFFLSCMNMNGSTIVETLSVKSSEPLKFILNTTAFKASSIKCSIISNEGSLVYSDKINTTTESGRKFDMSQLPVGFYTIELEDELKISRYELNVAQSGIQIVEQTTNIYKPVFKELQGQKVGVTMLTLGQTIKIELSDDDEKLHTLIIKDDQSISKIYDMSKLPRGTYRFRVSTQNRNFYHTVNI